MKSEYTHSHTLPDGTQLRLHALYSKSRDELRVWTAGGLTVASIYFFLPPSPATIDELLSNLAKALISRRGSLPPGQDD